jgi:hypothetical protein
MTFPQWRVGSLVSIFPATMGERVGYSVGRSVGKFVGAGVGLELGDPLGLSLGLVDGYSQEHVQISGNSSLTKRHASVSLNGPAVIPTLDRSPISDCSRNDMRLPQLYPSANVPHTSSVHSLHPHRNVGVSLGACVLGTAGVGGITGIGVGDGVLRPHLQTGSINEHSQFFDSVAVFPFVVVNFEYEH